MVAALAGRVVGVTTPGQMGPVLYNPALLRREELIRSFVVRHGELEELVDRVRSAPADQAPQHVLILGWRGMGKTTLLHRLGYAVEDDPELRASWLPVLFDEEQLNVGELADFWLNTLEMLSIAAGDRTIRARTDQLSSTLKGRRLEEAAYEALAETARLFDRRLLLLVDNVDLVLSRINPDRESSRLREILQHEPWLMLVGTSSNAIESTYDYGKAFYEMFRVLELAPLDERQTIAMLADLAVRYEASDVTRTIQEDPTKIKKLRLLMGGNPRTAGLLFGVLQEGPTGDFKTQLERLLDSSTSLYKERLENLPVQSQRVFVALAQRWEPATAVQIAADLRVDRGVVSGQLHRLVEKGLVEKVKLSRRALGFQVKERFFNIWCLMRGGRRSRRRLRWLVEAVDLLYDTERISLEARRVSELLSGLDRRGSRGWHLEYGAVLWNLIPSEKDKDELSDVLLVAASQSESSLGRPVVSDEGAEQVVAVVDDLIAAGLDSEAAYKSAFRKLRSMRQFSELFELAKIIVVRSPSSAAGWKELAIASLDYHELKDARRIEKMILTLAGSEPQSWEIVANLRFFTQDLSGARRAARKALQITPDNLNLQITGFALGVSAMPPEMGRFDLERTLPLLPLYVIAVALIGLVSAAHLGKSEIRERIGDFLEAGGRGYFGPNLEFLTLLLLAAHGWRDEVVDVISAERIERLEVLAILFRVIAGDHSSLLEMPQELHQKFIDSARNIEARLRTVPNLFVKS